MLIYKNGQGSKWKIIKENESIKEVNNIIDLNYYQMIREERIVIIETIVSNPIEILSTLNCLEEKHGIENVLPYYDCIIDLIKMGEPINEELTIKYYDIYLKCFEYNGQNLSNAIQALKYSVIDITKDLYPYLKWYQKLWIKIKMRFQ